MDTEIAEIRRLAGLQEQETYDVASAEQMNRILTSEVEFLGRLGALLTRALPPDSSRQVMAILQQRRGDLEQLRGEARREILKSKQQQAANAYADTDAEEVSSQISMRA